MRAWYRRGLSANAFVPRPERAAAHVCGPRPVRVLILGGAGPAIGWGVRCPELALPGQLAARLAAATGRGIDVRAVADPELPLSGALSALAGHDLDVDALVVVTGIREAVSLRSAGAWRRDMAALIGGLTDGSPSARVLVAGMQPVSSIPAFDTPGLGAVAQHHADRLNALTEEVCAAEERAAFTPLSPTATRTENRYRTPADYRHWAEEIALGLEGDIPALGGAHPDHGQSGAVEDMDRTGLHCESPHCPAAGSNRLGLSNQAVPSHRE